jgi:hypothetical protein
MKKIILVYLFLTVRFFCFAQNELSLDIATVKTAFKNTALGIGIDYLKQYNNIDKQFNGRNGFLSITPELTAKMGTSDVFSQLIVKLSGFYLKGKVIELEGVKLIDSKSMMHVFPISIGAESNTDFTFINSLVEVGYVPYYQGQGNNNVSDFLKLTQVSVFLQAGYKNKIDTVNAANITGGKIDESEEQINNGLLRSKVNITLDTKNFFTGKDKPGLGLIGRATWWYDFLNSKTYYRLEGKLRLYLVKNKYFDFTYEKGSGAPNFNKGEQFGAGLSVTF